MRTDRFMATLALTPTGGRRLLEGETAIIVADGPLSDTVVRCFALDPEDAVDVQQRPRRGDRLLPGVPVRWAVTARRACTLHAALLLDDFAHGEVHCAACHRTFYAKHLWASDHECTGRLPASWDEAEALAAAPPKPPKAR